MGPSASSRVTSNFCLTDTPSKIGDGGRDSEPVTVRPVLVRYPRRGVTSRRAWQLGHQQKSWWAAPPRLAILDRVFLTISTTGAPDRPATDLGFLLHKHPDRSQSFNLSNYGLP